jgi:gluconolactonase
MCAAMAEATLLAEGLQFPEGPVAMADGSIILVEIRRGTLTRVAADGTVSIVAECGGGPNGAAVGPDGAMYVCNNGGFEWHEIPGMGFLPGAQPDNYIGGRIQRVDLATGDVSTLYEACDGRPLRGPNDIVFDAHGGFWFTDLGKRHREKRTADLGGVYYATADGSSIVEAAFPLDHPNGIALSPGGDRVYAAETPTGRVWRWDVESPGVLARSSALLAGPAGATLHADLPGYQLLDSMAALADGGLALATLATGCVTIVDANGHIVRQIFPPDPDPMVTNVCFGGPGNATAYVTASLAGKLWAIDLSADGIAGLTLANTA